MTKKILIIEDEKYVRENLEYVLENSGYDVFTTDNGKSGLKLATEINPALIICDILMPGMSGYEVLQNINSNDELKLIPFIFLTAKAGTTDLRKGMELGADDYIFKPYSIKNLLSSVNTRLKRFDELKTRVKSYDTKLETSNDYIIINKGSTPQFIKFAEIKFIISQRQYTQLTMIDGEKIILRKSLNQWESILPQKDFLRIHRSNIVNVNYIDKVEKWFKNTYKLTLVNENESLSISRDCISKLKKMC